MDNIYVQNQTGEGAAAAPFPIPLSGGGFWTIDSEQKNLLNYTRPVFPFRPLLVADHPEFEHPLSLYSIELNFDLFFNELKNYPFEYNRVETEGSSEGINILLIEIKGQVKSKGIIWVLHKYDVDPL